MLAKTELLDLIHIRVTAMQLQNCTVFCFSLFLLYLFLQIMWSSLGLSKIYFLVLPFLIIVLCVNRLELIQICWIYHCLAVLHAIVDYIHSVQLHLLKTTYPLGSVFALLHLWLGTVLLDLKKCNV